MNTDLWHFTTTSGYWCWSPRSEAADVIVDDLRGAIGAARMTRGPVPIGGGLAELRINTEGDGWAAFVILQNGDVLVSCAVYWTPNGAAHAAAHLEAAAFHRTLPGLLVRPERAWTRAPNHAQWLDAAERCIAWAFIEEPL